MPDGEDPTDYLSPELIKRFGNFPASVTAGDWICMVTAAIVPVELMDGELPAPRGADANAARRPGKAQRSTFATWQVAFVKSMFLPGKS